MADDRKYKPDKRGTGDAARLKEGRDEFDKCKEAEDSNRITALSDINFAKLEEQWPDDIRLDRERQQRPCLTISKMNGFIRQVVNDARQNKPAIKVRAVDSGSDVKTADIISGLVRNIEHVSNADVAYDTAVDCSVSGGFGYIRVGMDYAFDDSFEMDLSVDRVLNQFSVYGDPNSTSADGSDWNVAFVVDRMPKDEFEKKYKGKAQVDFSADAWAEVTGDDNWLNDEGVLIAEWWTREEIEQEIVLLDNGQVYTQDQIATDEDLEELRVGLDIGTVEEVDRRMAKTHKVKQVIMSGIDILEENDWPGKYIPIIPVYGDEFSIKGKRYFRSLIHPAIDAQRMHNYWRTTGTELVALAPRVPWVGPKGSFDGDIERWNTSNTESHAFLEYDNKGVPPQRIPLDSGTAAGAMQEALNASDDMKSILGIYDASLGARSNETSGRAIMARQREGDVSTYHFIDNLSRSIRHVGRIIVDLIPHVYNKARIIRVIGEDGVEQAVQINQETQETDDKGMPINDENDAPIMALHDLTTGKYDVAIEAGPSFTTRREEAAQGLRELIQAYPPAAPILGPVMVKNLDIPGADKIAEKFEKLDPTNQNAIPPELLQQIQEGRALIQKLQAENEALKADRSIDMAKVKTDQSKAQTAQYAAETTRLKDGGDLLMQATDRLTPPPQLPPMKPTNGGG